MLAEKAKFLKDIILGESVLKEITPVFAFELYTQKVDLLCEVLLDLAFSNDLAIAKRQVIGLKTQVYLYEADTDRVKEEALK